MSDESPKPKFRLKQRSGVPPELPSNPSQRAQPSQSEPKQPLKLGQAYEDRPKIPEAASASVETYLNQAYGQDRAREKKQRLHRRLNTFAICTLVICGITGGSFAYAHGLQAWPLISPWSWYLPFFLCSILAALLILNGVRIYLKEKAITMLVFGLIAAGGLTYWNLLVWETTSRIDQYAPTDLQWSLSDFDSMLRVYEINTVRTGIQDLGAYTQVDRARALKSFRELPRDQWKPHFQRHLSSDEYSRVSVTNIDSLLPTVIDRAIEDRTNTWNSFEERALQQPNFAIRMKQWALQPYTNCFKLTQGLF